MTEKKYEVLETFENSTGKFTDSLSQDNDKITYAYLLKLNDFKVHKIGYWLICNAADENQKTFNNHINFKTSILSYKLKTGYIENTLIDLDKCLENSNPPISGNDFDNCRWFDERKNINI